MNRCRTNRWGFQLADPADNRAPGAGENGPYVIDWDEREAQRHERSPPRSHDEGALAAAKASRPADLTAAEIEVAVDDVVSARTANALPRSASRHFFERQASSSSVTDAIVGGSVCPMAGQTTGTRADGLILFPLATSIAVPTRPAAEAQKIDWNQPRAIPAADNERGRLAGNVPPSAVRVFANDQSRISPASLSNFPTGPPAIRRIAPPIVSVGENDR